MQDNLAIQIPIEDCLSRIRARFLALAAVCAELIANHTAEEVHTTHTLNWCKR